MDAYSGYNQIQMSPEDEKYASFMTDQGTYYYKVISFGLKNVGATYQRLMNKMFKQQIDRNMEIYVDNMLVKSKTTDNHIRDLAETFEANPEKIKTLMDMTPPRNVKDVQRLTRRLVVLSHFLAKVGDKYLSFFKALRETKANRFQ
ncbi:hypothetical protein Nepgr_030595 [Nepenthes gracilis]|uniref:Reverse transcriptase domain-containing protein n=1 Tax=Nepenthes gracilis TaxID=150966 RepID=A0AAD3Y3Z8_NEPGR|nr:hypothetical protein Nepgr_030595 [Nepenthes gracilis]